MSLNIAAEIVAATDAAGTLTTLRFAKQGFRSGAADTPPHVLFEGSMKQPAALRREMFSGGTSGRSNISWGEMVVSNIDGHLDGIKSYGFDGRDCTIRVGEAGALYPSAWTTFAKGTLEAVALTWSAVSFQLRDRLANFDKPLLQSLYTGSNALPNGVDGVTGDIKGQRRPRAYGGALNASAPCVNTTRLIYEVGACYDVAAAYDQGLGLTRGANYADQAAMEATAPAAGYVRAWPAGGYVRLGSKPVAAPTFDVTQGATVSNRTVAQLLKQIALDMGTAAGDISAADVAALDAAAPYESGVWVSGDMSAIAAMDMLAASVGAWYGFDRLGVLRMGQLVAPTGTPVASFTVSNFRDLQRVPATSLEQALPSWRVTVNYARNWTVQTDGLAGAVTAARQTWLGLAVRAAVVSNSAVKTQYLNAPEISRDGLLLNEADAATEAARLSTLYGVPRDTYTLRVFVKSAADVTIDLGSIVRITASRFGLNAGKLFVVTGIGADLANNAIDLTVWG